MTWCRFGKLCECLAFGILALAAFFKMIDLPAFRVSLESWGLIPAWARGGLVYLVPMFEAWVVLLWLAGRRRLLANWLLLGLLAVFAGAYASHIIFLERPTCNCLGVLSAFLEAKTTALQHLWFYFSYALLTVAGLVLGPTGRKRHRHTDRAIPNNGEHGVPA